MPITTQREPLCRTRIPGALAAEVFVHPARRSTIRCTNELGHRGACIFFVETATHIVQLAWWRHNFPPKVVTEREAARALERASGKSTARRRTRP